MFNMPPFFFKIDFYASTEILTDIKINEFTCTIYFNRQMNLMCNPDNKIIVTYTRRK
jgi:hypothetical protein